MNIKLLFDLPRQNYGGKRERVMFRSVGDDGIFVIAMIKVESVAALQVV